MASKRLSKNNIVPQSGAPLPASYGALLEDIKARIRAAQVKAALSINRELIELYWHIGKSIVERQRAEGWGKSVVERLSSDLQSEFSGISGFSPQNIWRMRALYLAWTEDVSKLKPAARQNGALILSQAARELDGQNLPQAVGEIPWFHNVTLIEKLKDVLHSSMEMASVGQLSMASRQASSASVGTTSTFTVAMSPCM